MTNGHKTACKNALKSGRYSTFFLPKPMKTLKFSFFLLFSPPRGKRGYLRIVLKLWKENDPPQLAIKFFDTTTYLNISTMQLSTDCDSCIKE